MKDDAQFEDRLRRQSLKPIPGEWREEILQQARRAGETRRAVPACTASWFEDIKAGLAALLWPAPRAWAGLATVWVAIAAMNLSVGQEPTAAMAAAVPVAQTRMALRQKQMLLTELAGRNDSQATMQSRAIPPRPRSQRREKTWVT